MICKSCGIEFVPARNDKRIKFCSSKCRCAYRNKTQYMKKYYEKNAFKWEQKRNSEEYKDKKNFARRERYKNDAGYRERIKSKVREYNRNNPTAKLSQHLKEYGMTIDDYNDLLQKQGYRCAICGCKVDDQETLNSRPLCVDHNHVAGNVRGLLCNSCNFVLGHVKDNISILENAVKYLKENTQ